MSLRLHLSEERGRKVPLIIPYDCMQVMERLVALRKSAGISSKNKYFFGRFGALTPLRATDSLRELTEEAECENPRHLRSTKMRKYVATLSQVFDLSEQNTQWLAEHLGHTMQVHREHYRLLSSILEKAKIAKLLIAIDSGTTSEFVGKSLDEINFDDISMVLGEPSNDEQHTSKQGSSQVEESLHSASDVEKDDVQAASATAPPPEDIPSTSGRSKPWPADEKALLIASFKKQLKRHTLPGKEEILKLMRKHPTKFAGRTWTNVKDCVRNIGTSMKLPKTQFN